MVTLMRWMAVFAILFGGVALAGGLALVTWDRTHLPRLPESWKKAPAAAPASRPMSR